MKRRITKKKKKKKEKERKSKREAKRKVKKMRAGQHSIDNLKKSPMKSEGEEATGGRKKRKIGSCTKTSFWFFPSHF